MLSAWVAVSLVLDARGAAARRTDGVPALMALFVECKTDTTEKFSLKERDTAVARNLEQEAWPRLRNSAHRFE